MSDSFQFGYYRHFKGDIYKATCIAKHSESRADLVVYTSIRDGQTWVRPVKMFLESVEVRGVRVPRFTFLGAPVFSSYTEEEDDETLYSYSLEGGTIDSISGTASSAKGADEALMEALHKRNPPR